VYVATEYWLAQWTDGADSSVVVFGIAFPPQSEGRAAQYRYLLVYCIIIVISFVATYVRYVVSIHGAGSRLVVSS